MQSKSDSSIYSLLRLAVNCNYLRKRTTTVKDDKKCAEKLNTAKSKKDVAESGCNKNRWKCLLLFKLLAVILVLFSLTFFFIPWEQWLHSNASVDESDSIDESDGEYYEFLATSDQHISDISLHQVNCSWFGYRRERNLGAMPQRCGTLVTDALVTCKEAKSLRNVARKLIDQFGDTSIHNRESLNLKWINFHNIFRKAPETMFTPNDYNLVKKISEYVKYTISITFGLPEEKLYFTNVTQFTRHRPLTKFSEFRHVDKLRSPSLVVTSIVWLSTVDVDFYGGRTEFLTGGPEPFTPLLIDPKIGRFAAWTSSYENPHGVHEILAGDRYALIFTFTVNKNFGHSTIDGLKQWSLDPANMPKKSGRRTLTFVKAHESDY